jgi:hypothetical protein
MARVRLSPTGILAALLWAGPALGQAGGVDIPPYPGSEVIPMGDLALSNGQPLRMYAFSTPASEDAVITHYRGLWEKDGQMVSVFQGPDGSRSVGYVDLRDGGTRTVSLMRQGELTLAFPAVLQGIPVAYSHRTEVAGEIPVHPRAEGLTAYESLEEGGRFRTVSYSVGSGLSLMEAFFLREMGQRGYQLVERTQLPDDPNSCMLQFGRGERRMSVTLAWVPRFQTCSVFAVLNAAGPEPAKEKP